MPATLPPSHTQTGRAFFASAPDWNTNLGQLRTVIEQELRPNLAQIDQDGHYPDRFMRILGEGGGFEQTAPTLLGGSGRGMKATIQVMEAVSNDCMSTGFCLWCQTSCAWYIQNGQSEWLKANILPGVLSGARMGATGLSNPMKHLAGIEKINLCAQRVEGGYAVNGVLPWVSNVHESGVFAAVAQIEGSNEYLMAVFPGNAEGLTLGDGGHFIALEGSSTKSARFRDVFVGDDWVLAAPITDYIKRIRPGFVLSQCGFGLGLIESCLELMKRANIRTGHVNCFLDDGAAEIEADWTSLRSRVYAVADEIGTGETAPTRDLTRDAIQARIDTSELALRASQAALLHAGAAGYRSGGAIERKLRESYFVAIVTPALKHLKKLQHDMKTAKAD